MEILSRNYNCRNPFVAGFLPALIDVCRDDEDQVDGQLVSKAHLTTSITSNLQIMIATTSVVQSTCLKTSLNQFSNTKPTTIYQIDVSKVCTPRIYTPNLAASSNQPNGTKSKKTLRNKRQKEARKRRRKNQRHVHFPEQDELIAIVIVVEDDECIKEYRNKYWEFFAIDRNRFERRVQKYADVLERVLLPSHREKVFKERFSCDESEAEEHKLDSGCDSSMNNDSDQGIESSNEVKIELNTKVEKRIKISKKRRSVEHDESNRESGIEHETDEESESEINGQDENEISLSIALSDTLATFHFIPRID